MLIRPRNRSLFILFTAAPLFLLLTQCSAGSTPPVSSEHCGGVACTGTTQCTTNVPLCAIPISATCLPNAPRECAWKLNISGSCPCMEHDVRHCNLDATTGGVQICTANTGRTATSWAACQATPVCTP